MRAKFVQHCVLSFWLFVIIFSQKTVAVELVQIHLEPHFAAAIADVEAKPVQSLPQLEVAFERADSTDKKSRVAYLLGRAYAAVGQPEQSLAYYQESRELSLAINDDELIHRADYGIASIYLYHDNPLVALDIFKRLRISDEKRGNLRRLGSTLNNIGVSYRLLGKPDLAMQYFIEALVYKEQYENPISVARTLTNIGEIQLDLSQLQNARQRLLQAEQIFAEHKRGNDLMRVYSLIGNIDAQEGEYDAAMSRYKSALDYYQKHGPESALATAYQNIADIYARKKQIDRSIELFEKALELSDNLSAGAISPEIAVRLGEAYLGKGMPEKAMQIYQQALAQVEKRALVAYRAELYLGLSNASEALGDYQQALTYLRQYQTSALGLQSSEMRKQAQELHQKFDVAEKEASIRLLEQENALRETELAAQAYQRNFWLSGSLLLLLAISFLAYFQRSKRKLAANKADVTETILEKKRALFANISHEFRTPLTLILGPLHQLKSNQVTSEKRGQLLEQIELNANRMLRMVEQVLQLAKMEAQGDKEAKLVLLDQVVSQTILEIRPLFEQKSIVLSSSIAPDCSVLGETELLEKVVTNLLSNAVKYTPENGHVAISLSARDDQLTLIVSDSGIGMTDEAKAKVFDRFVRAHTEVEGAPGVGIGLALVKEIIDAHKGSISVSSRVNEGTKFTVVMPRYQSLDKWVKSDAGDSTPVMTSDSSAPQPNIASIQRQEESAESVPSRLKVLIIDDHPEMVAMVADILSAEYDCLTETDSEKAVETAIEQVPDLVITDLMMPVLDGFEVSHKLREHTATSHIPLIMLTAKGDDDSRLKAWQSDIDAYISKPFNPEELLLRCAGLIKVRRIVASHLQLSTGGKPLLSLQPTAASDDKVVQESAESDVPNSAVTTRDKLFIERLESVVNKHYSHPDFDKATIASAVAMSERQLQRKMQALFGQTPTDYVRSFRLALASEALKAGEAVTQVAATVGFSSPAYFSQCFKQKFGISPSEFIRQSQA
ncbi:tetratricopeptide repeat protein [Corallincola platygyrae]|uniref:histidine kinase n=1 Tax=Corallincola platygyrae TaxID=1193278 RepID=A0ABW4XIJ5_9GAMM